MSNEAPNLSIFEEMLANEKSELQIYQNQLKTLTPNETKRKERIEKSISAKLKRIDFLEKRSVADLPFTLRQLYNSIKKGKEQAALPYPNFSQLNSMSGTNLPVFLKDLKKYDLERLKQDDLTRFIERVKSVFHLQEFQRTEAKDHDLRDLLCFLEFLFILDGNLQKLIEEYTEDYAVYFNIGSAFRTGQLVPQDEEFLNNVLQKHSKHIFFIFDKSELGSSNYSGASKKFELDARSTEGHVYHSHYISQLESFLGSKVTSERLNESSFTYTFKRTDNSKLKEVKLVFFNNYFCNYIFSVFDSFIKAASLRIFMCMASYGPGNELGGCDNFVYSSLPYVFQYFDYYMINPYSQTPYYTDLKEIEIFYYNKNEKNFKVGKVQNKAYPDTQPYPIINLREARKHNLSTLFPEIKRKDLLARNTSARHINLNALRGVGVPFKVRGNESYWHILRGGKQTKKQMNRHKLKRQTRRRS